MIQKFYIDSIFIDGIRTFDKFLLKCNKSANILVGPNGVGKSTLLKLLILAFKSDYKLSDEFKGEKYSFGICFGKIKIDLEIYNLLKLNNLSYLINIENNVHPFFVISDFFETNSVNSQPINTLKYEDVLGSEIQIFYFADYQPTRSSTLPHLPFFYKIGSSLYAQTLTGIYLSTFVDEKEILSFNHHDYLAAYRETIERKKDFQVMYAKFRQSSTKTFNKLSKSNNQSFTLTGDPRLEVIVNNKQGKDINKLSSGQNQLEKLKLFVESVKAVKPQIIHIDEPEIHLNYGQQFFLLDFLSDLTQNNRQIFIATHSNFFIQSSNMEYIKYLKITKNGLAEICEIPAKQNRFLANYPELFYANNIIIVEGLADKIFFERSLNIVLKENFSLDLSSLDTEVIAVHGKDKINKLAKIINQFLHVNILIIVDQDFLLRESNFQFISRLVKDDIVKKTKAFIGEDINSSTRMFKSMPNTLAEEFIGFLDESFSLLRVITIKRKQRYINYRKTFQSNKIKNMPRNFMSTLKKVRSSFIRENVWLLSRGTIEQYAHDNIITNNKLDIEKLQTTFYPLDKRELLKFLKPRSYKEISDIANFVKVNFKS